MCSFITSHVLSVVCRPGSFHDLKRCQYFLFLLIFKVVIACDLHSSSFLFPILIMLKQNLFKLSNIAFIKSTREVQDNTFNCYKSSWSTKCCVTGRTNLSHQTYRCLGLFKITLSETAQFAVFGFIFFNVCIFLGGIWLQEHLKFYSCGDKAKTAIGNGISWIMFSPSAHQDILSRPFPRCSCLQIQWNLWIQSDENSIKTHSWTELFIFPHKSMFLAGEEEDAIHACIGKLLEGKAA